MTIRQVFYRLVSIRMIENSLKDYNNLSRILTGARNRYEISHDLIVDRSRATYRGGGFGDLREYARAIRCGYRRDYWAMQPNYVEVWSEKDAIIGAIEPVTDQYGVTVRACRGFMSTTWAFNIAEEFSSIDKPIHVLYIGDHDPSGTCIEEDAVRRVADQMVGYFMEDRVAIHFEDIAGFNLPPLRIKPTDSRSPGYRREYGSDCVELDALPPAELRKRLELRITTLMDKEIWERCRVTEEAERKSVEEVANMLEAISNK